MDTLFWKTLSPKIKIKDTTKQFYKQYLYKLEVNAPGGKSIRCDDIGEDVSTRRANARNYVRAGSWYNRTLLNQLDLADIKFLYFLKDLLSARPDVKVRIEEPKLSIYSNDEKSLQDLVNCFDAAYYNNLKKIYGPANNTSAELLKDNVVLVKSEPAYKYKVTFREKRISIESREQILNYLSSVDALVKIPEHTNLHMTRGMDWIWGCYFYTNDPGIPEMIRLINPDIIREVYMYVCVK